MGLPKLPDKEYGINLDFFGRHGVSEDSNFNADRNRAVIARTIRKNEARRKLARQEYKNMLGPRIDMVASYLKSRAIESGTPADKYLGKRIMAKLVGEKIINKLKYAKAQEKFKGI